MDFAESGVAPVVVEEGAFEFFVSFVKGRSVVPCAELRRHEAWPLRAEVVDERLEVDNVVDVEGLAAQEFPADVAVVVVSSHSAVLLDVRLRRRSEGPVKLPWVRHFFLSFFLSFLFLLASTRSQRGKNNGFSEGGG